MVLRKRGVTFKICFRKRGFPQKRGVPTLEETVICRSHIIMCTPSSFCCGEGGEVERPTKFSKRGDLTYRTSIFRGGCWERGGVTFSTRGCNFYIKNKLNSEYLRTKRFINKNVFLCHN